MHIFKLENLRRQNLNTIAIVPERVHNASTNIFFFFLSFLQITVLKTTEDGAQTVLYEFRQQMMYMQI